MSADKINEKADVYSGDVKRKIIIGLGASLKEKKVEIMEKSEKWTFWAKLK